ncbi:MAG TPA: thymidine kinase [Candidatus Saccharibacteria bacterium]|nr:thymidine kinase [Candidatus Saccharibacteria bacterium]MCB9817155.1 thymidine kinase [Candidatus Nomurabacteria bacterium]HPR10383.1 thymidine kinase [Candidatus Saccharibacteria bacterium]
MAKLYFRYSAMNSGKSTSLLQTAYNYEERGMSVIVTKPIVDTKGDSMIVSRIGTAREVDFLIPPDMDIAHHVRNLSLGSVACVLVDEAQFLQPQQVDQLFDVAITDNIPTIAYGLRTDFQTHGFPGATRLLEIAHDLQELKTICRCGQKAIFNGRKIGGKLVFEGSQVAIDGQDNVEYESLCGACYKSAQANDIL